MSTFASDRAASSSSCCSAFVASLIPTRWRGTSIKQSLRRNHEPWEHEMDSLRPTTIHEKRFGGAFPGSDGFNLMSRGKQHYRCAFSCQHEKFTSGKKVSPRVRN